MATTCAPHSAATARAISVLPVPTRERAQLYSGHEPPDGIFNPLPVFIRTWRAHEEQPARGLNAQAREPARVAQRQLNHLLDLRQLRLETTHGRVAGGRAWTGVAVGAPAAAAAALDDNCRCGREREKRVGAFASEGERRQRVCYGVVAAADGYSTLHAQRKALSTPRERQLLALGWREGTWGGVRMGRDARHEKRATGRKVQENMTIGGCSGRWREQASHLAQGQAVEELPGKRGGHLAGRGLELNSRCGRREGHPGSHAGRLPQRLDVDMVAHRKALGRSG